MRQNGQRHSSAAKRRIEDQPMWPKVIAQLFELLPHITRLVPMADKFLSSKAAAEKANEAAMAAMAEGVRGDLGQVTKAHAGLYRQLQEQSAQITEVGEDVKSMRVAIEQRQHRIEALEQQVSSLGWWVKAGVSLLVVLAAVIIILLVQLLHAR
jgi:chromosome segregation ATPase